MTYRKNEIALVDTGFWYAVFDERDQHYKDAQDNIELLMDITYILPWPILYETLCTRFIRRDLYIRKFEKLLKRPNAFLLDDTNYKNQALECTLASSRGRARPFSLCDNVLRLIIDDVNVKLNYLFTFNVPDFSDVCSKRNILIINSKNT